MKPIPMILACSTCGAPHVDVGEWATCPHRTHLCDKCGAMFRPATVHTVGVASLPDETVEQAELNVMPPSMMARRFAATLRRGETTGTDPAGWAEWLRSLADELEARRKA